VLGATWNTVSASLHLYIVSQCLCVYVSVSVFHSEVTAQQFLLRDHFMSQSFLHQCTLFLRSEDDVSKTPWGTQTALKNILKQPEQNNTVKYKKCIPINEAEFKTTT